MAMSISEGQWININMADPRTHQMHVGYAQELAANTTLSIDYTHMEGPKRQTIVEHQPYHQRPAQTGTGVVFLLSAINKTRCDALTFMLQRRLPRATLQAHYTLAGSYSYGGLTGTLSGAAVAPGEGRRGPSSGVSPLRKASGDRPGPTNGTASCSAACSRHGTGSSCGQLCSSRHRRGRKIQIPSARGIRCSVRRSQ